MENLVNKIIEMNSLADEKVNQAKQKREQILHEIELEKQAIADKMAKKAAEQIAEYGAVQKQNSEKQIALIQQDIKDKEKQLEQIYQTNHEQWVDDLVSRVLYGGNS